MGVNSDAMIESMQDDSDRIETLTLALEVPEMAAINPMSAFFDAIDILPHE